MYTWRITFTVNGRKMEEIVQASTLSEAQRIIRSRYAGENVNFISTGHERM